MHAAATETGYFPGSIKPGYRLTAGIQYLPVQICFKAA
jgi:hypothetical protein